MTEKDKIIVIKLGTSSLFNESTMETRLSSIARLVEVVVGLRKKGYYVVLVSSGGIAAGLQRMGLKRRPSQVATIQAMAAIGQCRLMAMWEQFFGQLEQPVAQMLLTRTDIADRVQYNNAKTAMKELLELEVVPIVNENDSLTSREARFGDNDTLSAVVAAMVSASHLFLLTDVDCLYTANPRDNPDAKQIRLVEDVGKINQQISTEGCGTSVGTGGMTTKIIASHLASGAGVNMFITNSQQPETILGAILDEENGVHPDNSEYIYTKFIATDSPLRDRAIWILHSLTSSGSLEVDEGAYEALTRRNRAGLLPAGVTKVGGHFHAEECVDLKLHGEIVGRCLVNYSSIELERIIGKHSHDIVPILGYADSEYVAFRDNLAFYPNPMIPTSH